MVPFGGWEMPLQYGSILDEVRLVRSRAGLFDLGHMGRFVVHGTDAVALVDRVCTNHCAKIPVGAIRYSLLCREDGYAMDDLLIYRGEDSVHLVVNASNTAQDLDWILQHVAGFDAVVEDQTQSTSMLALQGPASLEVLAGLVEGFDLADLKYYRFTEATVCGIQGANISRTGYTGENGFELYLPREEGPRVWETILDAGAAHGVTPIGLGARDTLRLEAGMPLYGHEIDLEHNPMEAGLAFGISFDPEKGDYPGREALIAMAENPTRKLVGITTEGPRVPRQGTRILQDGEDVGHVCSGSISPTIQANIASAYVRLGCENEGTPLQLDIRGRLQPCKVHALPFYSRTRKKT